MPPQYMVTAKFLKQILKKEKKLLKIKDVTVCNPPKYDEISVTELYDTCIKMKGMKEHFPDQYPKGRQCAREFFFTILATKHPDYVKNLILNSKKQRFDGDEESDEEKRIEIDPEWEEELKAFPQFASKYRLFYFLIFVCNLQKPKAAWSTC